MKKNFDLISVGILALLGPLFIFPREKWNWVLIAGVAAIFTGRWIFERKFLPRTPIDAAMALLVLWALFGLFGVHDLAVCESKLAGLAYGVVLFYILIGALRRLGRIKIAIVIFISMSLAVSLVGTLSRLDSSKIPQIDENKIFKIIPKVIFKFERAETGINPNALGGTLLLFIPPGMMALAILSKKKNEFAKQTTRYLLILGMAIILGVEIVAIIYSRSFGASLAFGFILLMMGKKGRPIKVCLGLTAIFAFFFIMKSPDLNKNAIIKNTREFLNRSASSRLPLWKGGLEAAQAHPIFGLGLDRLRTTPPFKYEDAHAHNQFIHLAAEMGIPALVAYLAILVGAGWMTIEVTRSKMPKSRDEPSRRKWTPGQSPGPRPPWMILIMRGLAWGQIGFAIFGIADAIPLGSKPGLFFWISLALMTSIYLFGSENQLMGNNSKPMEAIG
jgi:putative inorganic carbon (hco3(-)) transporter